ncbi:MAG: homoserine O-acetyltransferase [Rhodothalassiaceae bacterium]|nr:MAG: homoserine O-acetyltransferase [Rhodothalassiaceae bacterium]
MTRPPPTSPQASSGSALWRAPGPFRLESGRELPGLALAYRTWGRLDPDAANAVLVFHALTGDQHVAGTHPLTGEPGWWDFVVGPGRIIDTDRLFVIAANTLGGVMGSTGPAAIDPATGRPWGPDFPQVTIRDMVRAQLGLLDALGVRQVRLAVGGSMGGMAALTLLQEAPERVEAVAAFAVGARHHAQQIALHALQRRAIMQDPAWHGGRYREHGTHPDAGLALARMLAHLSYRSPEELERRFGARIRERLDDRIATPPLYEVESYLAHHGDKLVRRFDANSYLLITEAMDRYDLGAGHDSLAGALAGARAKRIFLASFTSDWLYPKAEIDELEAALAAAGAAVTRVHADTLEGHDSFLLPRAQWMEPFAAFVGTLCQT